MSALEPDPGAGGDPADQFFDGRIAHRLADPAREEVDEHVVRVEVAVLDVHVLRVQAHQTVWTPAPRSERTLARARLALRPSRPGGGGGGGRVGGVAAVCS